MPTTASSRASAAEHALAVSALMTAAEHIDGVAAFNEDTLLSLAQRRFFAVSDIHEIVGIALTRTLADGSVEGELVVHPEHRQQGIGTQLVSAVTHDAARTGADVRLWAHGQTPGAVALATRLGLSEVRVLLKLGRDLTPADGEAPDVGEDITIAAFSDADADEFLQLNARVFRDHPEQGALDRAGLESRTATEWFDAADFLLARDEAGALLGYNWLKREGDEVEIYVVGVADEAAGRGIGRALMNSGLRRMHDTGAARTSLYVEGDNARALALYRSLGYEQLAIDVQYG